MAKTTTNQESVINKPVADGSLNPEVSTAEQSSVVDIKAKAEADAEAARLAEEEKAKQLDMSLPARKIRAQAALDEAIEAQNRINAIVHDRTKDLDDLITEEAELNPKNPMSEIQFYLNRQQRKRQEKAEQKEKFITHGLDPVELIKALDTRAPIDQKGGSGRKRDPRSMRPPAAK